MRIALLFVFVIFGTHLGYSIVNSDIVDNIEQRNQRLEQLLK